jgi:hypothetical protein
MSTHRLSCFANFGTELTALSTSELNTETSSVFNSSFTGCEIPDDEKRVRAGRPHVRFSGTMRAQSLTETTIVLRHKANDNQKPGSSSAVNEFLWKSQVWHHLQAEKCHNNQIRQSRSSSCITVYIYSTSLNYDV